MQKINASWYTFKILCKNLLRATHAQQFKAAEQAFQLNTLTRLLNAESCLDCRVAIDKSFSARNQRRKSELFIKTIQIKKSIKFWDSHNLRKICKK